MERERIIWTPVDPVSRPEEPRPEEPEPTESAPKGDPNVAPLPRSVEPVSIEVPDGIAFTPPRIPPVTASDITKVAGNTPGLPDGVGKAGWGDIISPDLLDGSPRTRSQASPVYPFEAKTRGATGQVVVEFIVDERGAVVEPRVVSSTDRVFEEASLRAVAKWRFEPGKRQGKVVRFRMAVPVVFNLNE